MDVPESLEPRMNETADGMVLYDARFGKPLDGSFSPAWWAEQGQMQGGAPGRGTTVFVRDGERELALRHYQRGGMFGRLLGDRYLWTGLDNTRPWREWHMLAELYQQGLSVPRPVAARCVRRGLFYRADLLTERLPGQTLAQWLAEGPLAAGQAEAMGRCIRRFHRAGVFHADLNARNILLDEAGGVSLIDFDKGELRPPGAWQQQNLARLRRSLEKFQRQSQQQNASFHFNETVWQAILAGYEGD